MLGLRPVYVVRNPLAHIVGTIIGLVGFPRLVAYLVLFWLFGFVLAHITALSIGAGVLLAAIIAGRIIYVRRRDALNAQKEVFFRTISEERLITLRSSRQVPWKPTEFYQTPVGWLALDRGGHTLGVALPEVDGFIDITETQFTLQARTRFGHHYLDVFFSGQKATLWFGDNLEERNRFWNDFDDAIETARAIG